MCVCVCVCVCVFSHIFQAVNRDGEFKRDDRCGFRVIDAEKFVEDLTSFAYFANGPRSFNPAYCVRHRVVRFAGTHTGRAHDLLCGIFCFLLLTGGRREGWGVA